MIFFENPAPQRIHPTVLNPAKSANPEVHEICEDQTQLFERKNKSGGQNLSQIGEKLRRITWQ